MMHSKLNEIKLFHGMLIKDCLQNEHQLSGLTIVIVITHDQRDVNRRNLKLQGSLRKEGRQSLINEVKITI